MSIILIGYRGSGKTTVGQLLARRLGWNFLDLDQQIALGMGMTIREIFAQQGEAGFRLLETQALTQAVQLVDTVISLGGGAVLAEQNRQLIGVSGHRVFYLRADPAELHRRIHADPLTAQQRPSLTALGGGIDEIRLLLQQREPLYRQVMHHDIDVTHQPPAAVTDTICQALQHNPPPRP